MSKMILVAVLSAVLGATGQKMIDDKASQNVPTIETGEDSIKIAAPPPEQSILPPLSDGQPNAN